MLETGKRKGLLISLLKQKTMSSMQFKGVARGVLGCPWPPFCVPFLTKQPTTGGENAMTISWPQWQFGEYPHFETVTPPLKNPDNAPDVISMKYKRAGEIHGTRDTQRIVPASIINHLPKICFFGNKPKRLHSQSTTISWKKLVCFQRPTGISTCSRLSERERVLSLDLEKELG